MAKIKIIILLAVLAFLIGCATEEEPIIEEIPYVELEDISVQLKWLHQSQFAGMYYAKHNEIYKQEGLDVQFFPFDFINFPIPSVQDKKADFGVTGADELLVAKSNGLADDVKAIAVIYKKNPVVFYSLKESEITKPQHFKGKTVGIERAPDGTDVNVGILYKAMIKKLEIDPEEINEITIGYDATELLEGITDVSSGYVINEPHEVIELGKEVNIILAADYGVNMYADILIAHNDLIAENPDLVEAFVKATIEGWRGALENPEKGVEAVMQYSTNTKSHEEYMLDQSIPLVRTGLSPMGEMDPKEWEQAYNILEEQELVGEIDLEDVYTSKFIDQIYQE